MDVDAAGEVYLPACHNEYVINRNNNAKGDGDEGRAYRGMCYSGTSSAAH